MPSPSIDLLKDFPRQGSILWLFDSEVEKSTEVSPVNFSSRRSTNESIFSEASSPANVPGCADSCNVLNAAYSPGSSMVNGHSPPNTTVAKNQNSMNAEEDDDIDPEDDGLGEPAVSEPLLSGRSYSAGELQTAKSADKRFSQLLSERKGSLPAVSVKPSELLQNKACIPFHKRYSKLFGGKAELGSESKIPTPSTPYVRVGKLFNHTGLFPVPEDAFVSSFPQTSRTMVGGPEAGLSDSESKSRDGGVCAGSYDAAKFQQIHLQELFSYRRRPESQDGREEANEEGPMQCFARKNSKVSQFFGVEEEALKQASSANLLMEPYLRRDYTANDITQNMEGDVTGGTFQALVERLTPHDARLDVKYVSAFLLTFRCFASPQQLCEELERRFCLPVPEGLQYHEYVVWRERKLVPIQQKVNRLLEIWMEQFFFEGSDEIALSYIQKFAAERMREAMPKATENIIALTIDRKLGGKPHRLPPEHVMKKVMDDYLSLNVFGLPSPSANLISPKRQHMPLHLTQMDPKDVAAQLTLWDSRRYCAIHPRELVKREFSQKDTSIACNVKQMSWSSTLLTSWVAETILRQTDLSKRSALIKYFIKVADCCYALKNYNSLISIVSGLNSSSIARLKRTWELLPSKFHATLESLRKATDHSRNYAEYRARLKATNPPCLPFLGLYLTDLTFISEGNPSSRKNVAGTKDLINFDKYNKIAKVILEMQRFQQPYQLLELPLYQDFLKNSFAACVWIDNPDAMYEASVVLEPRVQGQEEDTVLNNLNYFLAV